MGAYWVIGDFCQMPRDSLGIQEYNIMCVKVRWLPEIAKNHMQKYTAGISKWQQSKRQQLFKIPFFKQRVLKPQGSDCSSVLWPLESTALCAPSLEKCAFFRDISISSLFGSFLEHDTSRNKCSDSQLAQLVINLSTACKLASALKIFFTSTKII